jgi:hypothetical protein
LFKIYIIGLKIHLGIYIKMLSTLYLSSRLTMAPGYLIIKLKMLYYI